MHKWCKLLAEPIIIRWYFSSETVCLSCEAILRFRTANHAATSTPVDFPPNRTHVYRPGRVWSLIHRQPSLSLRSTWDTVDRSPKNSRTLAPGAEQSTTNSAKHQWTWISSSKQRRNGSTKARAPWVYRRPDADNPAINCGHCQTICKGDSDRSG